MISGLREIGPTLYGHPSGYRSSGPQPLPSDTQPRQAGRTGGGNQSPASLCRSVDKVLEESQYTGEINLSGRKLKEYPRSAANYDLIDTTAADLSRNRFSELPADVCGYHSLERLGCYHNVIRSISTAISQLQNLVYLNICRNQLSLLPTALCQLEQLQVLLAGNNRLVSIPEEIGLLHQLMLLDVSTNQITQLPVQLGELSNLRTLNVSHNQLVELPLSLSLLKLRRLDVSSNRISTIPTEYRNIDMLEELQLDNNPLVSPPAHICTKGLAHVMKHLRMTAERDERKRGVILQQQQYDGRTNYSNNGNAGAGNTASLNRRRLSATNSSSPTSSISGASNINRMSASNLQQSGAGLNTPPLYSGAGQNRHRLTNQAQLSVDHKIVTRDSGYNSAADVRLLGSTHSIDEEAKTSGGQRVRGGGNNKGSSATSPSSQSLDLDLPSRQGYGHTYRTDISLTLNPYELRRQKAEYEEKKRRAGLLKMNIEEEERERRRQAAMHIQKQQVSDRKNSDVIVSPTAGAIAGLSTSVSLPAQRVSNSLPLDDPTLSSSLYSRAVASPPVSTYSSPPTSSLSPPAAGPILNCSTSSESLRSNTSGRSISSSDGASLLINEKQEREVPIRMEASDWSSGRSRDGSVIAIPVNHVVTSSRSSDSSRSTPIPDNDDDMKRSHEAMVAQHWLEAQTVRQRFEEERARMRRNFMERASGDRFFDAETSWAGVGPGRGVQSNGGASSSSSINDQDSLSSSSSYYSSQSSVPSSNNNVPAGVQKSLESMSAQLIGQDPVFTIRRTVQQEQAERELIDELRQSIESTLQMKLPTSPDDLASALKDGVVLCHLVNHVRPRSVASIHVPSPAAPRLSLPKCRRNVDNFLLACRRIGMDSSRLCSAAGILEERELVGLSYTVKTLLQCSSSGLPKQSAV